MLPGRQGLLARWTWLVRQSSSDRDLRWSAGKPGAAAVREGGAAAGAGWLSYIGDGGDGFDVHQLIFVAEHRGTHEGAGDVVVTKRVPDYLPCGHQILVPG